MTLKEIKAPIVNTRRATILNCSSIRAPPAKTKLKRKTAPKTVFEKGTIYFIAVSPNY
jgi:hypothetical protein